MSDPLPDHDHGGLPVTVVIARRPAQGHEDDVVAWAREVTEIASRFPGHLGAEIYPPAPPERDDLVIAFSFDSAEHLSAWEHSAERHDCLHRLEPLVTGASTPHAGSGFEGIFAHGPGEAVVPPARWKTAIVIALALFPASLLLAWLLGPVTSSWPLVVRVLLNTAILVPYMSWVGVPYLTRWLRGWLHAGS